MSLASLDERDLVVLKRERDNLQETYQCCAKVFGSGASPNAAEALDRINDAISAIDAEIADRSAA